MAKHGKDLEKLTDEEWENLVRSFIQTIARLATRNPGAATKLAKATNLSKSAVAQMKNSGKASTTSFIRVASHLAGLDDQKTKDLLDNPGAILKNLEPMDEVLELFYSVREYYSDNELLAWLKLLHSKGKVENDLGISIKASLSKKRP